MRELAKRLCRAGPLLAALSAMPAAAATPGQGEAVLNRQTLSLALANNLATAALDACRAIGHTAVVAVVDRGGNLVALQRGDDVGPHNTAAAQRKAFTALSSKTPTILLAERARNDPCSCWAAAFRFWQPTRSSARSASPVRVVRSMTTGAPQKPSRRCRRRARRSANPAQAVMTRSANG
jgi:hypothetical protein